MTTHTVPTSSPLTASALTTQINAVSLALANMIQGSTAPTAASTGYASIAGIWWHDTNNNQIKVRDQANTTWILIGTLDETAKTFLAAAAPRVQTFTSSGTWTKPASGAMALVEVWSAGGSGSRQSTAGNTGGGAGGGFASALIPLSSLGATETVTVGAGGAAKTGSNQAGAVGGNSSFGSWLTVTGGGGGSTVGADVFTGGALSVILSPATPHAAYSGSAGGGALGNLTGYGGGFAPGGGGSSGAAGGTPFWNGSGAGGAGAATGTAGSVPGGGGGGGTTTSGAGGSGQIRVTVW